MWHLTWVCSDSIRTSRVAFFAILICLVGCMVPAVTIAIDPTQKDVRYATVDGQPLRLDFYGPEMQIPERPLIIWVHGGAWRSGTKANVPLVSLRKHGFAIASIEYRLSPVAKFPAQIHDIKAAVRYLRSQAERFDVAPDKFILAGSSAGGHLAVLAAVTEGIAELDPPDNIKIESAGPRPSRQQVQAVVSFFGAGNLQTILSQSTPFGLEVRVPALKLLLGGLRQKRKWIPAHI